MTLLLAEWISTRGFGDGFMVLLLTQLAAALPRQLRHLGWTHGLVAVACALVALAVLVQLRRTARMVPVQQAKRATVRRARGDYVPIRVMPSTFVPMLAACAALLALRAWTSLSAPWYLVLVFAVAFVFAVLAAPTGFDPRRTADDLSRSMMFVPGIRPGRPTQEYFAYVNARVTVAGTLAAPVLTLLVLAPAPSIGVTMLVALIVALRTFEDLVPQVRAATTRLKPPPSAR